MSKDNPFDPFKDTYAFLRQELLDGTSKEKPLPNGLLFQICVDLEENRCYLVDDICTDTYSRILMAKMLSALLAREADSLEYKLHKDEFRSED